MVPNSSQNPEDVLLQGPPQRPRPLSPGLPRRLSKLSSSILPMTRSLRARTLTCYSWYITVVPHLHYTLVTPTCSMHKDKKSVSSKPLLSKHKLGSFPSFRVHEDTPSVLSFPQSGSIAVLRQIFALTNVQRPRIDHLDIPSFMLGIRQYSGHFLPTVLSFPEGTQRGVLPADSILHRAV